MDRVVTAFFSVLFLLFCLTAVSAEAEEVHQSLWQRDALMGGLGGARAQMDNIGIRFESIYTSEFLSNVSGGIQNKTEYLGNVDLTLAVDFEKLTGWKGATFFAYGLGNHGGHPSENVGDAQTISNIDAPMAWKVYEAWLQQNLFEDKLSLLAGLYDLNSEFDVVETAGLFLNSSHGIGPDFSQSGENGPSIFPTTSAGVRVKVQSVEAFYLQATVLDGVPGDPDDPRGTHIHFDKGDGALIATEIAYFPGAGKGPDAPYRKIALGLWHYTAEFGDILEEVNGIGEPDKHSGNQGIYALADLSVYREKNDPGQGLRIFGRYGIADSDVNQFNYYLGGGLTYTGLISSRDEDQIGFAVAVAHNGGKFKRALQNEGLLADDSEVALEFTYRAQLTPWFALQPDFQYIINPGTDLTIDDAFSVGMRLEVSF